MKTAHIYVQGSVAFGNYISEIEDKYGVHFNISGCHDDTFYSVNPLYVEDTNTKIPHYTLTFLPVKPKNSINFELFIEYYMHHFEKQLKHTTKKQASKTTYSII
jgi:hypothetical protein